MVERAERAADPAPERRPAFYAARPGGWRDWWTLLHPPYTAWHLAYVVIGASLAPRPSISILLATLIAFFLAVGVAAHALDELHGRPLRTQIPSSVLWSVSAVSLAGAMGLGAYGTTRLGPWLVPFIVAGGVLVVGYNAELFGGVIHNTVGFAAAWGAFPVLVAYFAEARTLGPAALLAALGAFAFSAAQRALSTPARLLRRHVRAVDGTLTMTDGETTQLGSAWILRPLEQALRSLSWAIVLLAAGLAVARFR